MHTIASPQSHLCLRTWKAFLFAASLALSLTPSAQGQVATTTQLTISSPTVAAGVPTLLTATVTDAASHSVHLGTVTFFDGTRSLGSAQIVSGSSGAYPQGTANLKTASFTLGANSITAIFAGTKSDSASTSAAKTVSVTGTSKVTTTLSGYVTGTDFWLPATLVAYGHGTPTGDVDFVHVSSGATIGTKSLSGAQWKTDLSSVSVPVLGKIPAALAAGDFDGDGILDLATSNLGAGGSRQTNNLSVLLGGADGSFKVQSEHPVVGGYPVSVQTADFNNDGRLDLVVSNDSEANSPVGILRGNGDGTFQAQIGYGSGFSAADAEVVDLDRDGNLDLVVFGYAFKDGEDGTVIAVFLGNGDGTFRAVATYPLGEAGAGVVSAGDLNGDGIPDLVVAGGDDNPAFVFLGKGDGTFQRGSNLSSRGERIAVADVNHDGKPDVVLTNGKASTIGISRGKGDGTFEAPQTYSVPGYPLGPTLVDINQDGNLDIVITVQEFTDYVAFSSRMFFPGNGDGTFQAPVRYLSNLLVDGPMIAADFNGDGRPDLAETNGALNTVNVILNGLSTNLLLAKEELGPGTTTVSANYSGDEEFAGSVSNLIKLSPNGTPPPTYTTGFPDIADLLFNGSAISANGVGDGGSLLLTTGVANQAGSIFYAAPQNVQAFTTDFEFQVEGVNPADGLTFTIQNEGPRALGGAGGGLGYKDISKSVAIKFDLFNNSGEGNNSTGLYIDGESPEVPAVDLTSSGVNLHSAVRGGSANGYEDPFDVHITYDGATLTLEITDSLTMATFSDSWPIDIAGTVGGPTAYVGFTGATGGKVSLDQLNKWTYVPGTP